MRHFAGVLVGILLLPAFFALNWAVNFVGDQVGGAQERWWLLLLLVVYAVVGALTGVLLAWRSVSPTALLIGGVLLIATEVMLALPVLTGLKVNLAALYAHPNITDGKLLMAIGVALLFGGFLPTRWHRPTAKSTEPVATEDDERYAGAEILPGAPPADEAPTRQMPSGDRYDASWGTGRNDYVDEPEQPYSTRQMPRQDSANHSDEAPTTSYAPTAHSAQQESGYAPSGYESGYERSGYESGYETSDYQSSGYEQQDWSYPAEEQGEPDTHYERDPATERFSGPRG